MRTRLLLSTALLALSAASAWAGEPGVDPGSEVEVDPVTVIATRSKTRIDAVPATVSVITAEQIERLLVTDIKDLVRFEPGVSVVSQPVRFGAALGTAGRAGNEGFTIRGLGGDRVLIVVDGVRTPDSFAFGAQSVGRGVQTHVIKHWRQDWTYQPQTVLTYAGPDRWTLTPVAEDARQGAWSQTVWQTDDSPRYGGVGRWSYDHGRTEWASDATWRPLARRDATRDPIYDRYLGTNRHALMPGDLVHIQDNMKLATAQGSESEPTVVVQEDVVNTYRKSDAYDPGSGDAYWTATSAYWAEVHDAWDDAIARHCGVRIEEEAQTGSVAAAELMGLADAIQAGTTPQAEAITRARALIAETDRRALRLQPARSSQPR